MDKQLEGDEIKVLIVSQYKDKITESMEFIIVAKETCKSIIVNKEIYEKFKKITNKKDDNCLSTEELKGLGELMEKNMTKFVYMIIEKNKKEIFGTYSSREKAKEVLQNIIKAYENGKKKHEMPEDENEKLVLF